MAWSKDNSRAAKLAAEEALAQAQRAESGADYIAEVTPKIDEFVGEQTNLQTQLNDLVLQSGTDIAEVVQARGGEVTLNARLEKTSAQLAETEKELQNKMYYKQSNIVAANGNYVSFVIDDGYTLDYTRILPFTSAKGIPLSMCMITSKIGVFQFLTKAQLLELQNTHGWEIMSHTHNHIDCDKATEEELHYEFSTSKKILKDIGLNCESLVYPRGLYNSLSMQVASKYFRSALSTDHYSSNQPIDNKMPIETYKIRRAFIDTETLEQMKARVDSMNNTWIVFYSHSDGMSVEIEQKFKDIIDYVQSKNIPVQTVSDVLDKFENKFEINRGAGVSFAGTVDFAVSATGNLYSKNNYAEIIKDYTGVKNTSPLSFFPLGKVSIAGLTSVDNSGIGIGDLITYRIHEEVALHFQQFIPISGGSISYRFWDKPNGIWKAWEVYKPAPKITVQTQLYQDFGTIAIGATTIFELTAPTIMNKGVLLGTFLAPLPNGITAQFFLGGVDGKVKVSLTNTSTSALVVGGRSFNVLNYSTT